MATSNARKAIERHRRQEAGDNDALFADDRSLFTRGSSIGVTLTSTGRDVHDLDDDMDARVYVYSDAIVIVPGGGGDE